ncbi:hypothetical protein [Nitratireductor sp. ZSWI3]|uniref:hypothetical protein n=1 Tax=Nitratireductor sp. ZSWI3 TaxID=2966359 RepID=UPI002150491E|nr:hypothetical protein [Nitratireductor sp. ZSWI3]MCR4265346.1 hypothetical protein [Nitratireductor sp. ZSWI3]
MPDSAILAARLRAEAAWFRFLAAAGRFERALKYNPNWHLQQRVPAGRTDGGRWTGGAGLPVLPVGGRGRRIGQLRRRYPTASLAEITRLEVAASQARYHANRVRRLDPNWRGPTSVTATIRGETEHLEAVARAAQERYEHLTRGAIPDFNHFWSANRLTKELYRHGYRLDRPAKGNGWIYKNRGTGEEVRIMARPARSSRTEPDAKHLFRYYYRYRSGKDQKERQHVPIPDAE